MEPIASGQQDRPGAELTDGPEALTHALLRLVAIAGADGDEEGATDVSADKYKHLADAYTPRP